MKVFFETTIDPDRWVLDLGTPNQPLLNKMQKMLAEYRRTRGREPDCVVIGLALWLELKQDKTAIAAYSALKAKTFGATQLDNDELSAVLHARSFPDVRISMDPNNYRAFCFVETNVLLETLEVETLKEFYE